MLSKEEALADLSRAREGAANSTDVARGLAASTATRLRARGAEPRCWSASNAAQPDASAALVSDVESVSNPAPPAVFFKISRELDR